MDKKEAAAVQEDKKKNFLNPLKPRLKQIGMNALLLIATIILFFLVLEIVLQVFWHDELAFREIVIEDNETSDQFSAEMRYITHDNPEIGFIHKPNITVNITASNGEEYTVSINSFGFRDNEFSLEKPAGTKRIIVLGDSVTFGDGVDQEETYPQVLEQLLEESHPNQQIEVLNLGVSAYTTSQEVALFEELGVAFEPDLVIVGYVYNDPSAASGDTSSGFEAECFINLLNMPINCKLEETIKKSKVIRFVKEKLTIILSKTSGNADEAYLQDMYLYMHQDPANWKTVTDAFEKLNTLTQETETPVVVMVFPLFAEFDNYSWSAIEEQVTQAAQDNGFETLTLLEEYQAYNVEEVKDAHPRDFIHPNTLGHYIAAQALYKRIQPIIADWENK